MMDLRTVDDLATLLRSTPTAVRRMRERGTLPPAIRVGSRIYWDASELEAWLSQQREGGEIARPRNGTTPGTSAGGR